VTAAVMQRVSLAIEAMEQIRRQTRDVCDPRKTGEAAAQIALTAIRAQSQLEIVLREMVEATKEEAAE
jgi:hypothetical protein